MNKSELEKELKTAKWNRSQLACDCSDRQWDRHTKMVEALEEQLAELENENQ